MCGRVVLIAAAWAMAVPAGAQDTGTSIIDSELEQLPPPRSTPTASRSGQTAESAVGQAGVRQSRAEVTSTKPMVRINNRIQNRVQARIRNRIDRNYDPRPDATSAFEAADDETRQSDRRPRP
jgi:hypothetical protein